MAPQKVSVRYSLSWSTNVTNKTNWSAFTLLSFFLVACSCLGTASQDKLHSLKPLQTFCVICISVLLCVSVSPSPSLTQAQTHLSPPLSSFLVSLFCRLSLSQLESRHPQFQAYVVLTWQAQREEHFPPSSASKITGLMIPDSDSLGIGSGHSEPIIGFSQKPGGGVNPTQTIYTESRKSMPTQRGSLQGTKSIHCGDLILLQCPLCLDSPPHPLKTATKQFLS